MRDGLDVTACRLGLLPGQWETYTPTEIWALRDGWAWRRAQDLGVVAAAVHLVRSMIAAKPDVDDLGRMLAAGLLGSHRRAGAAAESAAVAEMVRRIADVQTTARDRLEE